jgi:dephospho-CoA kinase
MFIIGITGGIGSGKTTVANICGQTGLPVLDADQISRDATAAGGSAIPAITDLFGQAMLNQDGSLDREKMASLVFKDRKSLDKLSAIIHRQVLTEISIAIDRYQEKGVKAIFLDVPIPVKQGFLDRCDQVWVVRADDPVRIRRLTERGMSEEEARRRIAMQMTDAEYQAIGDRIIENNRDYASLHAQVRELIGQELGQRGIRFTPLEPID